MKNKMKSISSLLFITLCSLLLNSCQHALTDDTVLPSSVSNMDEQNLNNRGVVPYKFERINQHNFHSQGWREQQVNIASGVTTFSDSSDHVEIVLGPEDDSDPRLINGCITMNLPTGADPTLRRIRLRKEGYSGTLLADLTELKYSTYVVHNCPAIMVLQIDVTGDDVKDFNIFYEPRPYVQPEGFPPLVLNTWQQWDPLNQGIWHTEVSIIPLPGLLADGICTIQDIVTEFPNARIIDTEPIGHNGEGVRFTIGGNPRPLFDNTVGYFDALIIGVADKQHSTLYDFVYTP
jgi:hypothetical protein